MENLHEVPQLVEGPEKNAPLTLIIDGISITDVKGYEFLKNSPYISTEVELAIQLAKMFEQGIAEQVGLAYTWEKHGKSIRNEIDSRTLSKAVLILKKVWLFGEELYELYRTTY